ncbi:bifunctional methylenetetrahydrofolate dehydrogenase/methenyltetrahydrofolate cyclohydrolase [Enterococcus cecorum]|mgnify:FL=1|uniref:bifunctional methylenetetrahydrofolate dehydrogenase/methenyltetrahydrofolate cyclohydrolase n=1 Tax=Enterococcus cecorum TaxID=44008 RepID=UPI00148C809B|nr:bifunctional methylenetetrahydrofolate dehydrogenase/methenyltetrahydrofolate cyclohydrolase [Enterococcus cecorum]MCJ0552481.1 bifunctional methylenetetrahydrofolate dehydrogenase/methenyltetrahydrofolate cyclohydrolase [Enterococcus cecorum]MCJ0557697.1 bifunctional methylenetetrahydrofolate dehydrogenase/methenyltetrahydrofolate cyclohydrolase [Enterococcus cecorum]MCJ0562446.1 bifunctional methylenetetrahydrofolate dehydrogenase/methenyltetrahydrofolate cyclohydrolase [Enterococcus cecoru
MHLLNGKELAQKLQQEMTQEVTELKEKGLQPGLAVILVGEDPASQVYVRNKERAANNIGMYSVVYRLPETTSEADLITKIEELNHDDKVHGILVQLPLPKHINEDLVLDTIDPAKDVDGFHPMNLGNLFAGKPTMIPCTPAGIMELIKLSGLDLAGKNAVIIGRSNIVGKPMAHLLLQANATVTICHSKTKDLPKVAKQADVLVVAIGRANFVTADFVKEGAVVIDVGINRDENNKLTGDVKFDEVAPLTSYITPVPGGVGPMTITMLMRQTIDAAKRKENVC